jgi:hypothetical protein
MDRLQLPTRRWLIFASSWLLEHSGADLHADGDHFIYWQASTLRMFATSLAVRCLKFAERVFAIGRKMTSNPLNSWHLATDRDHLAADLGELVLSQRR